MPRPRACTKGRRGQAADCSGACAIGYCGIDAIAAARLGQIEVNVALDWCARVPAAGWGRRRVWCWLNYLSPTRPV